MSDYRQYCHVSNTAQHCRLGLFQDSDFAGDLEDSKSTSAGFFFFENVFRKSNMCSHKLDVKKSKHQCLTVPQNQWLLHWCELLVSLFLKARKTGRWCTAKKSDSLESDCVEILERTHQLVLNETAKWIRVWAEEDESPWAWSNNFEIKFADGSVVALTAEWVSLGILKEWQDKGILDWRVDRVCVCWRQQDLLWIRRGWREWRPALVWEYRPFIVLLNCADWRLWHWKMRSGSESELFVVSGCWLLISSGQDREPTPLKSFLISSHLSRPLSINWKGKHHFEENSRKEGRTCGSKAEVNVFDFSKLEQKGIPLPLVRMFPTSRWTSRWNRGLLRSRGELQETVSKEPLETACRTQSEATWLKVQGVAGNCDKRLKVFMNLCRKLNGMENDEMFDMKTNVLIWGLFKLTKMKSSMNLAWKMMKIWSHARTTTLEGPRRCSISLWGWL